MDTKQGPHYKYTLRLLSKKDYHSDDLRKKLSARGAGPVEVSEILAIFRSMNAIDDDRYLERKISKLMCSGYSKRYIAYKLENLGHSFSEELIDNIFEANNYSETAQIEQLTGLFLRKKGLKSARPSDPQLQRFLASRGHFDHP